MRILLLSAYDAASHKYWRQGLVAHFPEHEWTVCALPPRHFAWRVGGNALSWGAGNDEALAGDYDLIVATSLTDIATLKGLRPNLADTPTLCYFHENQFAYPENHLHGDKRARVPVSVEAQMRSIYSALAADRVTFNSRYNMETFLDGAEALLKKLPDHVPAGVCQRIHDKANVLPVPLADNCFVEPIREEDQPLTLVWNHRWEFDKGPDRLLLMLQQLKQEGIDFRLHVLGQQFRQQPEAFSQIKAEFAGQIGGWGFIESHEAYREVLRRSHIVLSTALHDFQGLAMQEAIAAGCTPVAPNRLAYPEYIPKQLLADSHLDHANHDASALATHIADISSALPDSLDVHHLSWGGLRSHYEEALTTIQA